MPSAGPSSATSSACSSSSPPAPPSAGRAAAHLGQGSGRGAQAGGRPLRRAAVRVRPARCVRPGRRRRPAVDRLRHLGGGGGGALGVPPLRRGAAVPVACSPARSRIGAAVALTPGNLIDLLIKHPGAATASSPRSSWSSSSSWPIDAACSGRRQRPRLPGRGHGGRGRDQRHVAAAARVDRAGLVRPRLRPGAGSGDPALTGAA